MRDCHFDMRLDDILKASEWEDSIVYDLSMQLAEPVLLAAFETQALHQQDVEKLRHALADLMHKAIHLGQCAQTVIEVTADNGWTKADFDVALIEIYVWSLGMFESGGPFHTLISSPATRCEPLHATRQGLRVLNHHGIWSKARVALRQEKVNEGTTKTASRSSSDSLMNEIIFRLQAESRLYIELLRRLERQEFKAKTEISDCFITLCSVALDLAADSLRLRWPI